MTLLEHNGIPCVTARRYDADGRWIGVRHYSPVATPDHRHIDTSRLALILLTLDAMRLGRPRARSGAERMLRAAGFTSPGRAYAFAFDLLSRETPR